ncbi:MAG: hypothetical protein ACI8TQ_003486 [Planctomycetota bacterium]|jgi:hypothetical protein
MSEDYSDQGVEAPKKKRGSMTLIVKLWLLAAIATPIVGVIALVAYFPGVKGWFSDLIWTQFEEPQPFEPTEAHIESLFT